VPQYRNVPDGNSRVGLREAVKWDVKMFPTSIDVSDASQ
jgi:hypothetical protein